MFSASEILDMAIRFEKNGEIIYRGAIAKLSQAHLASLLEWMAEEEAHHAKWFNELRTKLETGPENPVAAAMGRELFDGILSKKAFSLEEVDFSNIDSVAEMVETFIEFEKDTILFYQMLEAFIQDEKTLGKLREVIAEEKRHVEKLGAFLINNGKTAVNGR